MRSIITLSVVALATAAPPLAAAEPVSVPAFRGIELRGGGQVMLRPGPVQRVTLTSGSTRFTSLRVDRNGKLLIDACNRVCPRGYSLRIEIQSPTVPHVGVNGGGQVVAASGFARQPVLVAAVNGGGRVDLRAVQAATATAAVNGGGHVSVGPSNRLTAAVTGGGLVHYRGNPVVMKAVQGGGLVSQVN